jgi:hypothetical protein
MYTSGSYVVLCKLDGTTQALVLSLQPSKVKERSKKKNCRYKYQPKIALFHRREIERSTIHTQQVVMAIWTRTCVPRQEIVRNSPPCPVCEMMEGSGMGTVVSCNEKM